MSALDWLAWAVLCVQMPIPLFWLVVHPFVGFWRQQPRLVYALVGPVCWLLVIGLLYGFRHHLFLSSAAPFWASGAGIALVVADVIFIFRIHSELGGPRLFGRAELAGERQLMQRGLYAYVRHPRYTGMMAAVFGACLIAGTMLLWSVAFGWWLLALLAVFLEERELRARFGASYEAYARQTPRFLPFRFWPREE